jgi:hypothetical protein
MKSGLSAPVTRCRAQSIAMNDYRRDYGRLDERGTDASWTGKARWQ